MAIDNTPPRLQLIVTIAVITVISLVGIDFVLRSYYGFMTDDAQQRKLAPTAALDEQHKAEKAALTSANIDQNIAQLAKGSRTDIVKPSQSEDMGPMTGWSKLPKPAPTPETGGAGSHAAPPAGHESVHTGDAGALGTPAHMAGDAGAPKPGADAGAPPKPGAAADAGAPKGAPHK
jgi:hypothetical protein